MSKNKEHLRWIYNRMVNVHGENPNYDYMLKFDEIIGDKPINPPNPNKLYHHNDLHELFVEETMPSHNFKFIGTDDNIYRFDMHVFQCLLREERRDTVIDIISTVNGTIKGMVDIGLAKLLIEANPTHWAELTDSKYDLILAAIKPLKPINTNSSLHIHEEIYEVNGLTIQSLSAIADNPNDPDYKPLLSVKTNGTKNLGICVERGCCKGATTDYNGHKHYVCDSCYEHLTKEFEEDYD